MMAWALPRDDETPTPPPVRGECHILFFLIWLNIEDLSNVLKSFNMTRTELKGKNE